MNLAPPAGFGPILRTSPVLDTLGGFMSRGQGKDLEIGLLVGEKHCNSRGTVHGGVLATLADIGMGYLMVFGSEPPRRMTTASITIDYTGSAKAGDWIEVRLDTPRIGRRLAFANVRLMCGEEQIARASGVFAVQGE
jgi:uncharacterized protein (TIGR00369 family)